MTRPALPWDFEFQPYQYHRGGPAFVVALALSFSAGMLSILSLADDHPLLLIALVGVTGMFGFIGESSQPLFLGKTTDTKKIRSTSGAAAGFFIGLACQFFAQENTQNAVTCLCLAASALLTCAAYTFLGRQPLINAPVVNLQPNIPLLPLVNPAPQTAILSQHVSRP